MWFNGPVTEAISNAKKRNTILIVFVYDKESGSELALEAWEHDDVQSVCVKNACIALKFDKDSIEARQFAEYYPLISIPISFLINGEGVAMDVVVDPISTLQLKERIQNCLHKLKAQKSAKESLTKEDEVEQAKELLKQIKESKEKAAQESEREKEIQRREDGKSMLAAREKQKEVEMLAAAEERKKDKQADREYLKKLREQIAADRAEKSAKYQNQKDEDEQRKQKLKAVAEARKALTEAELERLHSKARIQFRLPSSDEPPLIKEFDSHAKFSAAYDFISLNLRLKQDFHLIQMYPRREFTASDSNKTFRELELTPSAVLMILEPGKARGSSSVQSYQSNWISYVFSMLFLPIVTVYNVVYNFIFPPSVNRNSTTQNVNTPRQSSNVRRLNDGRPDNDDNATWNGNSTQQL